MKMGAGSGSLGFAYFLFQFVWYSVSFLYTYRHVFLLVGKFFFYRSIKCILHSLSWFSFLLFLLFLCLIFIMSWISSMFYIRNFLDLTFYLDWWLFPLLCLQHLKFCLLSLVFCWWYISLSFLFAYPDFPLLEILLFVFFIASILIFISWNIHLSIWFFFIFF